MKLSIVIPCYKSSETIALVVDELISTLQKRYLPNEYEIILVEDASPDQVGDVIDRLADQFYQIKAIHLSRNFGQHSAVMAGFNYVEGDVVVCLDDDGQTPANEIFKLIDLIDEDCDVVYAKYISKKHNLFRNTLSRLNNTVSEYLLDKPKDLYVVSYFAVKRYIVDEVKKYVGPYPYLAGLILRVSQNIKVVDVIHRDRINGESGYTLNSLVKLWLNEFTSFSMKPLRVSSLLGFLLAITGFIYGFYTFINKLINPEVIVGYSSIQASILFVGGMILVMLGLIGEYVGRIFISINNSPQYCVKSTKNIKREL